MGAEEGALRKMVEGGAGGADASWYRAVLEHAGTGILVVVQGRVVYANAHAAQTLGRAATELAGMTAAALLGVPQPGPDGQVHDAFPFEIEAGNFATTGAGEYTVHLPSGAAARFAVTTSRIAMDGKPAWLAVLNNITAQRQAEAAQREREDIYRSMVGALNEGVLIFDSSGRVQGANPSAERLLGRTLAQMRATGLSDWRPVGADREPLPVDALPVAQVLASGEPRRNVLLGDITPSGALVWLNVNAEPLRHRPSGALTGAVVSFSDVTERRRVEEALIGSESTNRTLMSALADGVFVAQDHRFVFSNPALPAMLGYAHEEFIGMRFEQVLAPGSLALWTERFRRRIGSGEEPEGSYEVRFLRKGGEPIDLELVANRTRYQERGAVLGVVRNITDRKRAEAELERHRHHLEERVQERTRELQQAVAARLETETFAQTITDNQPTLLAHVDTELRVHFANRAYLAWFGKTRDEVIGRRVPEVLGHVVLNSTREVVSRVLAGEAVGLQADMVGADGRMGHFWIYRLPNVRDGKVLGYYFIATDITEIKRAEQRLQEMNGELVKERNRAEAAARTKSSFLANMSHEIRTPMNAIIGLTHLLQRDTPAGQAADRLGKVSEAAQHLLTIINDILDLSKIEAGKLDLERVDFSTDNLLSRCVEMVTEPARRKGLALAVDRGDLPARLNGDPTRLSQALVNLLSNAVKFTEKGGVSLRCSVLDAGANPDAHAALVRFEVQDTGVGIPPDRMGHLFTAFEQADTSTTRRFGGTGLGLAITRHLALLMGGTVGLSSEPGVGSRFWFTAGLRAAGTTPVAAAVAPQLSRDAEQQLRENHAGARVLLADDNAVNQELAGELLRLAGLEVDVAETGGRALAMARNGRYELILMDVQMPEMDGLEATRSIRGLPGLTATPIIAMTASAFSEDRAACLAAGMNDHIGKPVDPPALYETVLQWLSAGRGVPAALPDGAEALDTARGLAFFAGHTDSYKRALQHFATLYANGLPALNDLLAGRPGAERGRVGRELHSMGGAGATVGALDLAAQAQRLDALLQSPAGDAELRPALQRLQHDLATLVQRLREHPPTLQHGSSRPDQGAADAVSDRR